MYLKEVIRLIHGQTILEIEIKKESSLITPQSQLYLYLLQTFARLCSHVDDFNTRNKCLTAKLLKQVYRYQKF